MALHKHRSGERTVKNPNSKAPSSPKRKSPVVKPKPKKRK